jgi:hypothetical protein
MVPIIQPPKRVNIIKKISAIPISVWNALKWSYTSDTKPIKMRIFTIS